VGFVRRLRWADVTLIFVSDGASLIEKGLMVGLATLFRRGTVVRFSSGYLPAQCNRSRFLRMWLRLTIQLSDAVVVQSDSWRDYYKGFAGKSAVIRVIPNGVVTPKRTWERRKAIRNRIVYVGWINKAKGVFDLLAATGIVAKKHPELSVALAGGGMSPAALHGQIASFGLSGRVHSLGWVPHEKVDDVLASSELFVLPSYAEGLPNALLEAMSIGIPVIATRVGAISEVVEEGKSGLLVEPGDVPGLADSIDLLLANEEYADRLGAEGRKAVLDKYSMERVCLLWARILAGAAAKRGKSESSDTVFAWLK
jgi:glycosyltransferase involved in cell wall biosynthesis